MGLANRPQDAFWVEMGGATTKLRGIRREYPSLWELLLAGETKELPTTFKPHSIGIYKFSKRFQPHQKMFMAENTGKPKRVAEAGPVFISLYI